MIRGQRQLKYSHSHYGSKKSLELRRMHDLLFLIELISLRKDLRTLTYWD
jgi:hypothetical protein